jgi:hypothetical protein
VDIFLLLFSSEQAQQQDDENLATFDGSVERKQKRKKKERERGKEMKDCRIQVRFEERV